MSVEARRNALIKARRAISTGQQTFVCVALGRDVAGLECAAYIGNMLRGTSKKDSPYPRTVVGWLASNHAEFYIKARREHSQDEWHFFQNYRLAWIDHMLETDPFFGGKDA